MKADPKPVEALPKKRRGTLFDYEGMIAMMKAEPGVDHQLITEIDANRTTPPGRDIFQRSGIKLSMRLVDDGTQTLFGRFGPRKNGAKP